MRLTFLGTAADEPTPDPWCTCLTCETARTNGGRDVRLRSAALINDDLLIDIGPDIPAAGARLGISLARVQAILVTHPHSDHLAYAAIGGRDRTWPGTPLPALGLYANRVACERLTYSNREPRDLAALRVTPHTIRQSEQFVVETGGAFEADPRLPRTRGDLPTLPRRRYEVWTLPANHSEPSREAMLFVVRQIAGPEVEGCGAFPALFYATDTDTFPRETWDMLERIAAAGIRLSLAVIDGTFGDRIAGGNHMTMERMIAHHGEIERRGFLAPNARRLATHFLHAGNPPHAELLTLLAPHGIEPAYDGLRIAL